MQTAVKLRVSAVLWMALALQLGASAQTIAVDAGCTLANAINYANSLNPNAAYTPYYGPTGNGACSGGASGANTIRLPPGTIAFTSADNNWYGPNALPPVWSSITIEGDPVSGTTLQALHTGDPAPSAANAFRFFYVSGGLSGELPPGSLTLHNLSLTGGVAKGGDGGNNGGGGAGMGGAIFNQGTLTLSAVTLRGNTASGGVGGGAGVNGGGGGIGQDAGASGGGFGGSWSGGYGGNGGSGSSGGGAGGGGGFLGGANGSGGIGNSGGVGGGQSRFGDSSAFADGGTGGNGPFGGNGGNGGGFGFGGASSANGAGGGGGGVGSGGAAGTNFGGSSGSYGGGGGFAGGGGGGTNYGGGFGGGGAFTTLGGFGAGRGASGGSGGGGGAGMGGAIFNHRGTLTLLNVTATANSAAGGGIAGGFGVSGSGLGAVVFNLNGTVAMRFSTLAGNTVLGNNSGTAASDGTLYSLAYGDRIENGAASASALSVENSIVYQTDGLAIGNDVVASAINGSHVNTSVLSYVGANVVHSSVGTPSAGSTTPLNADPQLVLLENWGGPTLTMPPAFGSPAIDAAPSCTNSGLVDQRGVQRPEGPACDIGAVEVLQDEHLTVTVSAGGSVSADLAPAPIAGGIANCTSAGGAACAADYFGLSSVSLTATAQSGFVFSLWGADCVAAGSPVIATATIRSPTPACSADFVPMFMNTAATSTVYGGDVAVRAALSASVPLTGTVTFKEISPTAATLCANAALVDQGGGSSASCVVTTPPAGIHTVEADYAGNGVDSATTQFVVDQAGTAATLAVSPPGPIALGSSVTVSVTLSVIAPGAGNPTGTITVGDGSGAFCTIAPPATSCTLTPTGIGEKTLAASYGGDNNFIASTSNTVPLSVTPAARLVTATSSAGGGVSPASQYVADGNRAALILTPDPGYTPAAFGGSCPAGLLSGNVYITGAIAGNCTVNVTFQQETLNLSVTDHHAYARYGGSVVYQITLSNPGATDLSGVSLSATAPAGLDLANSRWQCLGSGCTASGRGPFADSGVTVPANGSVFWLVTVPVLPDAAGAAIDYTVSVNGAGALAPQTDSDVLVIFHDAFDVPNADGAQ